MKRIIYIFCALCLVCSAASCFGDKDGIATPTLGYVEGVGGIPSSSTTTLYLGDYLALSPEITLSEGSQIGDYTFRWMLAAETIGNAKDLNWQISVPHGYGYGESITGVFIARNTKTTLEFRKTFTVKIENNLAPTWMAIYEATDGAIEWMSIQGTPENITRTYPGMNKLVNADGDPITGNYRGAMVATNELMIFTDKSPGYGRCISLVSGDSDMPEDIGEKTGDINGRVYMGSQADLDFHSPRYCEGGTRFLILNEGLYAFDGTNKRLPAFDDQAFLRATGVKDVLSSKQFMRYKKAVLVHYNDGTLGCFHAYNLDESPLCMANGVDKLHLDKVHGMFAESTSLTSNKPYQIYIIGQSGNNCNLYIYSIDNTGAPSNTYLAPVWVKTIPLPQETVDAAGTWWSAFAQKYGFFATANEIYKFDYLDINSFAPEATPFKSYPPNYKIVGVFPFASGTGLNNNEYGTMVYLYDESKNTTSMQFIHTGSGAILGNYPDAIPGKGLEFLKR